MAFIIDQDLITRPGDLSDKGVTGPRDITTEDLERLAKGEGTKFKMYDDDGILYYKGRILLEEMDFQAHTQRYGPYSNELEFQPLDCFGGPNAGCTMIKYRNPETKKWEIL